MLPHSPPGSHPKNPAAFTPSNAEILEPSPFFVFSCLLGSLLDPVSVPLVHGRCVKWDAQNIKDQKEELMCWFAKREEAHGGNMFD